MNIKNISRTIVIPSSCRERVLPHESPLLAVLRAREVQEAGIGDLCHPYEIARPSPQRHVVIYTLSGRGCYETTEEEGELGPGDVWIAPAGSPHHYWTPDSWRIMWFHLADVPRWKQIVSGKRVRRESQQKVLVAALERLLDEFDRVPDGRTARLHAELVGVYLDREMEVGEEMALMHEETTLQTLWDEIEKTLERPWTIAGMAAFLHVSPIRLHRTVRRIHGATPMTMVTRLRMQRAQDLLRNGDLPIYSVAELVGYATPFAFSRAFRRFAGMSPRAFRRLG
ncbi:helix-turn-helix domain-containing protein [Candidatus Sumerlaeota bacterium]|nr:helix-turn-helix domain-containing protein [Candidatus Sumerlaeota bacterium]